MLGRSSGSNNSSPKMLLRLHHRTEYRYSEAVSNNSNELRMTPITTRWQKLEGNLISVLPATPLSSYEDLNQNNVSHFEIAEPHSRLVIDSRASVSTSCKVDFENLPYGFSHSELHRCRRLEDCYPFLLGSEYIELTPAAWRLALDIQGDSKDVFQTSYAIMDYIYSEYQYDPVATNVSTHANETLENKRGVCQDFAHSMVTLCRSIHIPARYVSGYFFDATRDRHLRGSEASHAWVEVYVEPLGWIGLDPTNRKVVDETYIILARGRDYRDVAPVIGAFMGNGKSAMQVSVSVEQEK